MEAGIQTGQSGGFSVKLETTISCMSSIKVNSCDLWLAVV